MSLSASCLALAGALVGAALHRLMLRRDSSLPRALDTFLPALLSASTATAIASALELHRVDPSVDSFFTLSVVGQVALFLLSTTLAVLFAAAMWFKSDAIHRFIARRSVGPGVAPGLLALVLDTTLACVLLAVALRLLPQVHYELYRVLLSDLPAQWVATRWIGPTEMFDLLTLRADPSLAAQSTGLALRVVLALTLLRAAQPWLLGRHCRRGDSD